MPHTISRRVHTALPVSRILATAGYEVVIAKTGLEAADLIAVNDFDAILTDISMPKMSGVQLLRIIRARGLDVPVLLMTGQPELATAVQAIELGALQYFIKPINLDEVRSAVMRAVRLHRIARLKREAFELLNGNGSAKADLRGIEALFERALASLWIAYQPIVRTSGPRALFGHEALLRSREDALPSPIDILDAATRLGRLSDLGRKIRRTVAEAIPNAPPQSLVFVNLHPQDLMDDELYSAEAPLSLLASRVVLEMTERESLEGITDVRDKVAALRMLGYRIAIDDLGAGYAGLTSFVFFEPEFAKIDMSLIRNVDTQQTKEKLIGALAVACSELGVMVIAEGVQTVGERDTLARLDCSLIQGYLVGKPGAGFIPRTP